MVLVEQRLLYNSTKYYVWTDIRLDLNLNITFFETINTLEFDTIDEQINTVRWPSTAMTGQQLFQKICTTEMFLYFVDEMLSDDLPQACVELLPMLVEHHGVGVPV